LDSGINLFSYVKNNPINIIDSLGLRRRDITDLPDPLSTPIQHYYFKQHMKTSFSLEFKRGMKKCKELRDLGMKFCIETAIMSDCFDLQDCKKRIKLFFGSCKRMVEPWKTIAEEYSYSKSIIDFYKYTEMEALEYYRNQIGSTTKSMEQLLISYLMGGVI